MVKETETVVLKYIYLKLQLLVDFLAKKHILILTLEDLHFHLSLVNVDSSSLRYLNVETRQLLLAKLAHDGVSELLACSVRSVVGWAHITRRSNSASSQQGLQRNTREISYL